MEEFITLEEFVKIKAATATLLGVKITDLTDEFLIEILNTIYLNADTGESTDE